MKLVEFHPEARIEFLEAAIYYEERASGLGSDFISLVEQTLRHLQDFPSIGRPFGDRLRRILVPRFPFALLYRENAVEIFVVAVMHLHRRPGYWRTRTR